MNNGEILQRLNRAVALESEAHFQIDEAVTNLYSQHCPDAARDKYRQQVYDTIALHSEAKELVREVISYIETLKWNLN